MGTTTVKIPAEHAEAFRDAVLVEIRSDGKRVADSVEEEQRAMFTAASERRMALMKGEDPRKPYEFQDGDIMGSMRSLRESFALLEPAIALEPEISGDIAALQYAFETVLDKVLAPRLDEELNVSPVDAKQAKVISRLTDAVGWAAGESARLEALWQVENAKKKAVA